MIDIYFDNLAQDTFLGYLRAKENLPNDPYNSTTAEIASFDQKTDVVCDNDVFSFEFGEKENFE